MTVPSARWTATGVVLIGAFVALGLVVSRRPLALDVAIADGLRGQWQRPAGTVATVVSDVLGPVLPVLFGAALLIAAAVCRQRERALAGVLLRVTVVVVLCRLTSVIFKPVFLRARPRQYPDLGYPSGHVVSTASTGFGAVLLCLWLAPRLLRRVAAISIVATVLCGASRLVLGVHWFTDTVGAVLAVLGVGLLASAVLRLLPRDPLPADAEGA
jgi:membrane-associated phospholipid phosphatase